MTYRNDLDPHNRRNKALAKFNHDVVDLDDTLEDLVKVLKWSVEKLRDEILAHAEGPVSERNTVLTKDFGARLKEVTSALAAATSCQNSLRRSAKARLETMTPEQRREMLALSIMRLPYPERRALVLRLVEDHNQRRQEALDQGFEEDKGAPTEGRYRSFTELL